MSEATKTHPIGTKIRTRTADVWMEADGIVRFKSLPNSVHKLEDAVENVRAGAIASNGVCVPCLVDLRIVHSMAREARMYYAGEETAKWESAAALIISSGAGRMLGNFFMGLNKPLFPTKLFTDENEALNWLKGLRK